MARAIVEGSSRIHREAHVGRNLLLTATAAGAIIGLTALAINLDPQAAQMWHNAQHLLNLWQHDITPRYQDPVQPNPHIV